MLRWCEIRSDHTQTHTHTHTTHATKITSGFPTDAPSQRQQGTISVGGRHPNAETGSPEPETSEPTETRNSECLHVRGRLRIVRSAVNTTPCKPYSLVWFVLPCAGPRVWIRRDLQSPYIYTHKYIHTQMCAYIHTYTHTHTPCAG